MRPTWLRKLLDDLPESALVFDVGGWAEPDRRADWVIDLGDFATRNWYRTLGKEIGPGAERFTSDTWVQRDVCASDPWPFEDGMFDVVLCTQTLEDLRDPVRVCEEMARVGKAGYVETPAAAVELARGVESPLWCGWHHHRWLVRAEGSELVFLGKPHHVHSPFWPSVSSPRHLRPEAAGPLEFRWEDSFSAREEVVIDHDELERLLRQVATDACLPRPVAAARRRTAETAWRSYRRLRRAAGTPVPGRLRR